jgi:catechol 2,3-dioxygenase-like lactoylglutathione lyase family enzyme
MNVSGVDFTCVPTQDFEAAQRFYGETLGLSCTCGRRKPPFSVGFVDHMSNSPPRACYPVRSAAISSNTLM